MATDNYLIACRENNRCFIPLEAAFERFQGDSKHREEGGLENPIVVDMTGLRQDEREELRTKIGNSLGNDAEVEYQNDDHGRLLYQTQLDEFHQQYDNGQRSTHPIPIKVNINGLTGRDRISLFRAIRRVIGKGTKNWGNEYITYVNYELGEIEYRVCHNPTDSDRGSIWCVGIPGYDLIIAKMEHILKKTSSKDICQKIRTSRIKGEPIKEGILSDEEVGKCDSLPSKVFKDFCCKW